MHCTLAPVGLFNLGPWGTASVNTGHMAATAYDGSCNLDYMCLEGTVYDPELMGWGPATCPGDFNLDGMVALEDLLSFLQVYSTPCSD